MVVKDLIQDIILGIDWLYQNFVMLDFGSNKLSILGQSIKQSLDRTLKVDITDSVYVQTMDASVEEEFEISLINRSPECETDNDGLVPIDQIVESVNANTVLNETEREQLLKLLLKYRKLFSNYPGLVSDYQHQIHVKDGGYYFEKNYPVPMAYRDQVEEQLAKMVEQGIIERASSPYINPLVVVIKKDKGVRLCLDARELNKMLIPERESPMLPQEILQKFNDIKYMSTVDLVSSYWQIALTPDSRKYTAFKYNHHVYQFKRLPFGLSTSVASFIRCLNMVLGDDLQNFTITYVDDILVSSTSFNEHLDHLEKLFIRLSQAGMTINFRKSLFVREEVPFLGYVLTPSGLCADTKKLLVIQNWPSPQNARQLKAFLGLCSYYRQYSSIYAQTTVVLQELLHKGTRWDWNATREEAFQNVKALFIGTIHLAYPDYTKPFYVQCDASEYGLGSQLFQYDEDRNIRVITMASRLLKGSELNYTTSEKELLAIVWAVLKFRIFILGTQIFIITDHLALTFLMKCRLLSGRLTRWILILQEFDLQIQHCSGKENVVADILSRYPQKETGELLDPPCADQELMIAGIKNPINSELRRKLKTIGRVQEEDSRFGKIIRELKSDVNSKFHKSFKMLHGNLFYSAPKGDSSWKLCLPKSLIVEIVTAVHKEIGHFGSKKCHAIMKEYFFGNHLSHLVGKVASSCDTCQRAKHSSAISHGTFAPIIPTKPSELVAVDIYGPLPSGAGGARYILVFLDVFSKLVTLYSMRKATALACARHAEHYIKDINQAKTILSDHGTQFTSELWYERLEQLNVRAIHSSIRHPQSNPSERVMRELGRLFRTYCSASHNSWVKCLEQIEEWLNSVHHESTGFAPFELHFNQKIDLNIAKLFKYPTSDAVEIPHNAKLVLAREKLIRRGNKRKQLHEDKYPVKTVFAIGDLVLLKSLHLSKLLAKQTKKFFLLFEGPYQVSAIAGQNAYELVEESGSVKGVFNVINLKPYKSLGVL